MSSDKADENEKQTPERAFTLSDVDIPMYCLSPVNFTLRRIDAPNDSTADDVDALPSETTSIDIDIAEPIEDSGLSLERNEGTLNSKSEDESNLISEQKRNGNESKLSDKMELYSKYEDDKRPSLILEKKGNNSEINCNVDVNKVTNNELSTVVVNAHEKENRDDENIVDNRSAEKNEKNLNVENNKVSNVSYKEVMEPLSDRSENFQRKNNSNDLNNVNKSPESCGSNSKIHIFGSEAKLSSDIKKSNDIDDVGKISHLDEQSLSMSHSAAHEVVAPETIQYMSQENHMMPFPFIGSSMPSVHQMQWSNNQHMATHPFFSRNNIYLQKPDDAYRSNLELWSQENMYMPTTDRSPHFITSQVQENLTVSDRAIANGVSDPMISSSLSRKLPMMTEREFHSFSSSTVADSHETNAQYHMGSNSCSDYQQRNYTKRHTMNTDDHFPQKKSRSSCKCVKSRCLMLYCECFQGGKLCTMFCSCLNCLNTKEESGPAGERTKAVHQCLKKNKDAFKPKVKIIGGGCACKNSR